MILGLDGLHVRRAGSQQGYAFEVTFLFDKDIPFC